MTHFELPVIAIDRINRTDDVHILIGILFGHYIPAETPVVEIGSAAIGEFKGYSLLKIFPQVIATVLHLVIKIMILKPRMIGHVDPDPRKVPRYDIIGLISSRQIGRAEIHRSGSYDSEPVERPDMLKSIPLKPAGALFNPFLWT